MNITLCRLDPDLWLTIRNCLSSLAWQSTKRKRTKKQEVKHGKEALQANGYEDRILEIPKKRQNENNDERKARNKGPMIGLPYMKGISEPLARTLKVVGLQFFINQ